MGCEPSRLDFALIGHLESWEKIANVMCHLRDPKCGELSMEQIREIVPWIPPRATCRITIRSHLSDESVWGIYIDTFITPNELRSQSFKKNLVKVQPSFAVCYSRGCSRRCIGRIYIDCTRGKQGDSIAKCADCFYNKQYPYRRIHCQRS